MALTLVIHEPDADAAVEELALTFDAPRIVIGRGKSCELQLLDASVSQRHASIRREGGRNLIMDEGSTNGILVGNVRLPPHTPRAVSDGELVRIGRVWIEVRVGAGMASATKQARQLALRLLQRRLERTGEPVDPCVRVVDGPDADAAMVLSDVSRDYVIGRSRECDLVLADELISRSHASVSADGAEWRVRDHGSKRGSHLDGKPLDGAGSRWPAGGMLTIGESTLQLERPVDQVAEEILASPDVRMSADELAEPPPADASEPTPQPLEIVEAPPEAALTPPPRPKLIDTTPVDPKGAGYISVDLAVVLVALGLIGLSMAALWWVLG